MFARTFALVQRSLLVDSRDVRSHLMRAALPALFIWTIWSMQRTAFMPLAPGLRLFYLLSFYNYIFITFAAATFFATAVSEEREEQTLGLLQMAGLGPLSILLGKWLPRMWTALLMLLVQLPLTLLCLTLGGITWHQIVAAMTCIFAHLLLMGGFALFCSVMSRTSTTACTWATIGIAAWHLLGWGLLKFALAMTTTWKVLALTKLFGHLQLQEIANSTYSADTLSIQVYINAGMGLLFVGLSWLCFNFLSANEGVATTTSLLQSLRHARNQRERRAWSFAPQIWFGFYYIAGGPAFLVIRVLVHLVAAGICYALYKPSFSQFRVSELGQSMLIWGILGLIIEGALIAAQILRSEVSQKTWSTLCMLPYHMATICYPRLLGATVTLLPPAFLLVLGFLLAFTSFGNDLTDNKLWVVLWFLFGSVVCGLHLATLYSISIDWSAWPVSIFLATATMVMYGIVTFIFAPSPNTVGLTVVAGSGFLALGLSAMLHLLIARKLRQHMGN